eukprot:2500878-Pyramimonas_sp.AAC.1
MNDEHNDVNLLQNATGSDLQPRSDREPGVLRPCPDVIAAMSPTCGEAPGPVHLDHWRRPCRRRSRSAALP